MAAMKGLENQAYLIGYLIANAAAILLLVTAWKWPRTSRLLFFLLFAWACWINWSTVSQSPQDYLSYADLAFSGWYRQFIRGWFSEHTRLVIGMIATCQGLIAVSMLLRGWIFKTGAAGGIAFLVAIIPLGVGSGFPCTLIMAAALVLLLRSNPDYIWRSRQPEKNARPAAGGPST